MSPSNGVTAAASWAMLSMCGLVVLLGTACVSASPNCDPSYECQYKYLDQSTGMQYAFDFSSGCAAEDYVFHDSRGHRYNAQVCGTAQFNCLPPTWTNTYDFGVAVQSWGVAPPCTSNASKTCTNAQGTPECCSADCQVLGTGAPSWSLIDPSNPATGGVKARFLGAAASDSDPFWCPFNPATGAQYPREVHFNFFCDLKADTFVPVSAFINATNDCHYTLNFKTRHACTKPGLGGSRW